MAAGAVGHGYDGDDFYCDVAVPNAAMLRVEHEDEWVLAFHHTRPHWMNHVLHKATEPTRTHLPHSARSCR